MTTGLAAIAASLSLSLVVVGASTLRLRRVVGPARRRTDDWKEQGLCQLAIGVFVLSTSGPRVFNLGGWPQVWVGLVGLLVAAGFLAAAFWDDFWAWEEQRWSNNRS